ncbi:glycosyltransferase [Sphingomonas sp. G-3-2-10]|uniref:glycosyltransferase n=1 Tax=Sphingomonas sp. G-3-2-10 TaxID=2728838 RepID=UPI00146D48F8|nr:glycosyltransferase [Sphingomonas sp. G-3-2-10]NML05442.1 glycosyltransferase [Sphingomonas sp. G-3-2-10]
MPIHILHLHSTFNMGGKEARAVRLMNAFGDRARHTIVSAMPDQLAARDAIDKGIKYEIAQNPPPLTGRPSVKRYEDIARFMRRFDLVLTYNWGAIDGAMAARVFGKGAPPIVHHEDGFNADEATRLNPVRNLYRKIALKAANALVVPSTVLEGIAQSQWGVTPDRLRRIPNGIRTELYAKKPDPKGIPGFEKKPGEVVIGTIAGLRPVKDLPLLVHAVAGMSTRMKLVIVGEGPERANIENAVQAMGLEGKVILPGFLSDPHRFVGLFDIFALTSLSEQAPISVIEAMAAGLPVVASTVGDIEHMVSEPNRKYLSPERNAVVFRDRIEILAQHPEGSKAIGEANRERARALFGEADMIRAYAALYGEAMGRPGILG